MAGNGGLTRGRPRLPFQRFQEGRFFTANIGARAAVDPDVDGDVGSEDVLADITGCACLLDGRFEDLGAEDKLATDINVGTGCADGVAGEHMPSSN